MKMHPSQIAQEIKEYPFFKIFKADILLQLSTMVEAKSYAAGDCILIEGQNNNHISFLRSGIVEVYISGQKLTELSEAGEVMGEMSVATEKSASTTIVAQNEVQTFSILNTAGQVILKGQVKDTEAVDIRQLPAGFYCLNIQSINVRFLKN